MPQANRADVFIRLALVGVIRRVAKHLGLRFQFSMNFKTNGWLVRHKNIISSIKDQRVGAFFWSSVETFSQTF